jgi:hypothetical protein
MTRQAARKRFGATTERPVGPEERTLGPVTAFDEMAELEAAGNLGWRTSAPGCSVTGWSAPTPAGSTGAWPG